MKEYNKKRYQEIDAKIAWLKRKPITEADLCGPKPEGKMMPIFEQALQENPKDPFFQVGIILERENWYKRTGLSLHDLMWTRNDIEYLEPLTLAYESQINQLEEL